jgi:hypothetical protein
MLFKKAYYYFYYQLYKSINPSSIFSRQFRANLYLDVLFIIIGLSGLYIYGTFIDSDFEIGDGKWHIIIYIGAICIPNYFIFEHNGQWKYIISKFDKLPRKTNQIGRFIVWSIITLIIANLFFSIYLMDQKARDNQTGPYSKEYIEEQK